ncbi:MAG: hypothetical protein AAGG56_01825 [Pseudomonadota bacterium]
MDLLTNGLLIAATLFAGCYCWVLAKRVKDLKSLDKGLGKSIVTLTRQIELARVTLEESRQAAKVSRSDLADMIRKADEAAARVGEASHTAQDMERGLRYQINQSSEQRQQLASELARADQILVATSEYIRGSHTDRSPTSDHQVRTTDNDPLDQEAARFPSTPQAGSDEETNLSPALEAKEFKADQEAEQKSATGSGTGSEETLPQKSAMRSTSEPVALRVAADQASENTPAKVIPHADDVEPWPTKRSPASSDQTVGGLGIAGIKPLRPRATKVEDLPKPQPLPSLGNPLRNKSAAGVLQDEDELLEALSVLAGGGKL